MCFRERREIRPPVASFYCWLTNFPLTRSIILASRTLESFSTDSAPKYWTLRNWIVRKKTVTFTIGQLRQQFAVKWCVSWVSFTTLTIILSVNILVIYRSCRSLHWAPVSMAPLLAIIISRHTTVIQPLPPLPTHILYNKRFFSTNRE